MSSQAMNGVHLQGDFVSRKNYKSNPEGGLNAQKALHAQYVLQLLQLQRRAGFLCDITIHVKDHSFKAHKPLLAACSLYFRALFANVDSKESAALNLTSLTPSGFQVLLDYMYSGSLAITAENSSEVLSAAICLQMTNVVETCLSFMRSSFQISKSIEPTPLPTVAKQFTDSPRGLALSNHATEKHSPTHNTACRMSNSKDQLQIVSAQSIKEAEFKSMVIDAFHRPSNQKQSGTSTHHLAASNDLPSDTQLDSAFHRQQKAAVQVQKIHGCVGSSLPPVSIISNSEAHSCASTFNPGSSSSSNFYHKSNNSHFHQPSHETTPTPSLADGLAMKPPAANNHLYQNGFLPSPVPIDLCKVSSAKDLTTSSSAVHLPTTSERNSGIAQAEMVLSGFKEREATTFMQRGRDSLLEQYSLDEPGNKVEISSEEDSEYNAWSADRSVMPPSDLSVTPWTVVTQSKPSPHHNNLLNAHSLISNGVEKSLKTNSISSKTFGSKASSLPSLSPKTPKILINVPRARSSEDRPVHVDSALRTFVPPNFSSPTTASFNTSEGNDCSSKHGSLRQLQRTDRSHPADVVFDDTIKFLKVEAYNDFEKVVPVPIDLHSHPLRASHAFEMETDLTHQFLKDHADAGETEEENCGVLDLSMPQNGARCSFSIPSNDHSLHTSIQDSDSDTMEKRFSESHHSSRSSTSDSGMHVAADPLGMSKQSNPSPTKQSCTQSPTEQWSDLSSENSIKSSLLQDQASTLTSRSSQPFEGPLSLKRPDATFSRKPRRTNGGQTCTWPGCGKLIRHRHMFEEHIRRHELGTHVSQLRRCYTGARVKKTVREQLEELRTSDNVFEGTPDSQTIKQNIINKRKTTSDCQEPLRKRVTARDRSEAFLIQPVATSSHPTSGPFVQHPAMRIHQSLSYPPLLNDGKPPLFLHPSTPTGTLPGSRAIQMVDSDGSIKIAHAIEMTTHPSPRSTAIGHSVIGGSMASSSDVDIARTSVPSAGHSPTPVEATLALLGIRTPSRGGLSSTHPKNLSVSNLSTEQMRRRLAIRETKDACSAPAHGETDLRVLTNASGTLSNANDVSIRGTVGQRGVLL